jgi:hypothetical protein
VWRDVVWVNVQYLEDCISTPSFNLVQIECKFNLSRLTYQNQSIKFIAFYNCNQHTKFHFEKTKIIFLISNFVCFSMLYIVTDWKLLVMNFFNLIVQICEKHQDAHLSIRQHPTTKEKMQSIDSSLWRSHLSKICQTNFPKL